MKRLRLHRMHLRVVVGLASSAIVAVAATAFSGCSNGTDVNATPASVDAGDTNVVDGSTPDDGTVVDGGDADIDASDAEVRRTCTEDGVCHTDLPPKTLLRDVWSAGDGVVWAVGWSEPQLIAAPGSLLRWDGTKWSVVFTDPLRLQAVWGSSATDIWVGGDSGLFHGTGPSSDALTWTKVRDDVILSIWGTSANDVWAAGSTFTWYPEFDGKLFHYQGAPTDGTDGWTLDPISDGTIGFRKVWGSGPDDVWIGGTIDRGCSVLCTYEAVAFHRVFKDGQWVWTEHPTPSFGYNGLKGGYFTGGGSFGPNDVWLMGGSVTMLNGSTTVQDAYFVGKAKTDGSGDFDWNKQTFGTCTSPPFPCKTVWFSRAVWGTKPDDLYMTGDFGQVRHWDGTQFTFLKTTLDAIPLTANLYAMWGSSNDDLWIVGDQVALHKTSRSNTR